MAGNSSSGSFESNWGVSPSDILNHFGSSGMSVASATAITHPLVVGAALDDVKVLISNTESVFVYSCCFGCESAYLQYRGKLSMQVVKNEGVRSLYLGFTPSLIRSVVYGGLRLGLYEPSKHVCELAFESTNVFMKIASGAFSGAVATALTNPVEVLKVRLQMNTKTSSGPIQELKKISSEEGVRALWKGVGPAMARASVLTASQLATYDESKKVLTRLTFLEEGFYLHLTASTIAGTVSTIMTAPIDMVKTRLMMQRGSTLAGSYKNGFHCAYQVLQTEGPRGLYKGGFAIFARLGPQTMITFIVCEKLREFAGLKAL